jgi:hypothetical protein
MILAIGVAAIVIGAISTVFFSALHLREVTQAAVDNAAPLDQALAVLRRDLQGAVPPSPDGVLTGNFKVGNVTSTGQSQPVAIELFTTTGVLRANEPWGDIQRVTNVQKNRRNRRRSGPQCHPQPAQRHHPQRPGTTPVERRRQRQVPVPRRRAMGGRLGHLRRHLDQHQSARRRPRPDPDGRHQPGPGSGRNHRAN